MEAAGSSKTSAPTYQLSCLPAYLQGLTFQKNLIHVLFRLKGWSESKYM
jgi:hypothetical protein